MNAVRIRKRLEGPIPGLPELTPYIGRSVEIIVLDESDDASNGPQRTADGFWQAPSADALAAEQGVQPIDSIDELGSDELADAFEGFDDTLNQWRREPWRGEEES